MRQINYNSFLEPFKLINSHERREEKRKKNGDKSKECSYIKMICDVNAYVYAKMMYAALLYTSRTPFEIRILCLVFVLVSVVFFFSCSILNMHTNYKLNCVRLQELCALCIVACK